MGDLAFGIGRRIGKHPIAGVLFCATERLLPLRRVARANGLVAFHHPRPIADPHILIVPTRPVASLTTDRLKDEEKAQLYWGMVNLAREIASGLPARDSWQLVINGGTRQDIGQLHGHLLVTNEAIAYDHQALADPASHLAAWLELMKKVKAASTDSGAGYSLVIQWQSAGEIMAKVTTSPRT